MTWNATRRLRKFQVKTKDSRRTKTENQELCESIMRDYTHFFIGLCISGQTPTSTLGLASGTMNATLAVVPENTVNDTVWKDIALFLFESCFMLNLFKHQMISPLSSLTLSIDLINKYFQQISSLSPQETPPPSQK